MMVNGIRRFKMIHGDKALKLGVNCGNVVVLMGETTITLQKCHKFDRKIHS